MELTREEIMELLECKVILSALKRMYQEKNLLFDSDIEAVTGWVKPKEIENTLDAVKGDA